MSFLSLPNEILFLIAENITDSPRDFYHLLSTSHHLYHLTISRFHRLAHQPKDGQPALHWAARHGHIPLLKLLLSQGVDSNLQNPTNLSKTALHIVSESNITPPTIPSLLLKYGALVNLQDATGATALSKAIISRNYTLAKLLLDEPSTDVNIPDVHGATALHHAVQIGPKYVLDLTTHLLHKGAHIDHQDHNNMSALYHAVSQRNKPLIQHLIHHGANLFLRQELGYIGIRRAVMYNDTELVGLFLEQKGADINYRDITGKTVLHYAACLTIREMPWDLEEAIKLLVERGADVSMRDDGGMLPLDLVRDPSDRIRRLLDPELA